MCDVKAGPSTPGARIQSGRETAINAAIVSTPSAMADAIAATGAEARSARTTLTNSSAG